MFHKKQLQPRNLCEAKKRC